jgi:hypothetical protein
MVGHNLQLEGTPEQWDTAAADLAREGINITISPVGVLTALEFANHDAAADNWFVGMPSMCLKIRIRLKRAAR